MPTDTIIQVDGQRFDRHRNKHAAALQVVGSGPARYQCKSRGMTLIELMVTVSIAALLALLAAPSIQDFIARTQINAVGGEFNASLLRARNEAVSRNTCTTVCMSSSANASQPACTTSGSDWSVGWIVFLNPACDSTATQPNSTDSSGTTYYDSRNLLVAHAAGNARVNLLAIAASGSSTPVKALTVFGRGNTDLSAMAKFNLVYDNSVSSSASSKFGYTLCLDSFGRTSTIALDTTC